MNVRLSVALLAAGCSGTVGGPAGDPNRPGDSIGGDPVAGDSIGGDPVAGDPIAGDPIAGDPWIAGDSCAGLLVEPYDSLTQISTPAVGTPTAGTPFIIPETSTRVTRITDAADSSNFASFYTNGYSRWSPANITGEYVTAFASNGGTAIYRLADRTVVRTLTVGEPNELHWDSSNVAGTRETIYYRTGAELRRVDALTGVDTSVHDFTDEYGTAGAVLNGVEGAPSFDMQYWAFQICTGMTSGGQCTGILDVVVYDLPNDQIVGRLSDVETGFPTPNFVEMSPSGARIVVGSCAGSPAPFNGPYAWARDFSSQVRLSTHCTHSGWAWGLGGEELYINFDSCGDSNNDITFSCDYMMAIDINDAAGWANRLNIVYQGDVGWGVGNHIGRIYDSNVRGWFFMSTYGGPDPWADQLLFVEIVAESAGPRVWRVTPALNDFQGYWSEAFASLDFAAQHIYWGANWDGEDNLELYQAELCPGWWQALAE